MVLARLTVGEMFSTGGLTTLLGISITFITLLILVGCIMLMDKLKVIFEKNRKEKYVEDENKSADVEIPLDIKQSNDEEVVAAITAALTLVLEQEYSTGSVSRAAFRVKKITRI